jgi:hypothetical protein
MSRLGSASPRPKKKLFRSPGMSNTVLHQRERQDKMNNRSRHFFLTFNYEWDIIDWRLIFALCRFGGLRCPSEILELTWDDVNWETKRFTVHSSKTEHHSGGGIRIVPIFPELEPYLLECFENAKPGVLNVITRYRMANVNLRTQFERIIKRAGLKPWEKLFQNLRSTRETELAETFPLQVVCSWIGNSQPVAMKHYLQVTEEHYQKAQQKAQQYQTVQSSIMQKKENGSCSNDEVYSVVQDNSDTYEKSRHKNMGVIGLRPSNVTTLKTNELQISEKSSGAVSGAFSDKSGANSNLKVLLDMFKMLSADEKKILKELLG